MEREQKGRQIADARQIKRQGDTWLVPSVHRKEARYNVVQSATGLRCSCPDFEFPRLDRRAIVQASISRWMA